MTESNLTWRPIRVQDNRGHNLKILHQSSMKEIEDDLQLIVKADPSDVLALDNLLFVTLIRRDGRRKDIQLYKVFHLNTMFVQAEGRCLNVFAEHRPNFTLLTDTGGRTHVVSGVNPAPDNKTKIALALQLNATGDLSSVGKCILRHDTQSLLIKPYDVNFTAPKAREKFWTAMLWCEVLVVKDRGDVSPNRERLPEDRVNLDVDLNQ